MAKRKSKTNGRRSGNRTSSKVRTRPQDTRLTESNSLPPQVEEIVEEERRQLMKAESLLGCIFIAMEYEDEDDPRRPYYPDAIDVARSLVYSALDRLDSVQLSAKLTKEGS